MNLGKRIKQASKSLYLADSFMTLRSIETDGKDGLGMKIEKKIKPEFSSVMLCLQIVMVSAHWWDFC